MDTATPVRHGSTAGSLTDAFEVALYGRAPASAGVFVGLFDLADWMPWLDEAILLPSATERARAQARRQAVDRDRLILCYALHRMLLAEFLRCDADKVPLWRDAAGCPRVAAGGLQTSLSHAGHCMAAAVAASGPVGVDIESATRAPVMPDIVGRLCHPDDMPGIDAQQPHLRGQALLRLWVRKEAFLKAAGTGLRIEMDMIAVPEDADLVLPEGGRQRVRVRMLDAGNDWVAAVAAPSEATLQSGWLHPWRARPAR